MTEPTGDFQALQETNAQESRPLDQLVRDAAELLRLAIKNTDPASLDFKEVKQITGALKDLAELMGQDNEERDEGIVIRIEGDPSL